MYITKDEVVVGQSQDIISGWNMIKEKGTQVARIKDGRDLGGGEEGGGGLSLRPLSFFLFCSSSMTFVVARTKSFFAQIYLQLPGDFLSCS